MNNKIDLDKPVKLHNKWYIKIQTNFFIVPAFMTSEIVDLTVGQHLKDWLDDHLMGDYSLSMHFNNGDPYYNLLLHEDADVSTVMLRYS